MVVEMKKKVRIIITDGHNYDKSVNNGRAFTSVGFFAGNYGGSSPCDNAEEISKAVKHCKNWIREERDIPIVVDKRECAKLTAWGF